MSSPPSPPGGLSFKEFKLAATEVGQWIWGTAQGAFNEKQTLAQIITDAVIGMIPLVGDVTAVRDLIAVGTGLAMNPKKRDDVAEWVLLVILVFALIPVIGGVIKGVGRIALKLGRATAAESKLVAQVSQDIVHFLNRIGHKNADAWFKKLNVEAYQGQVLYKFRCFCDTVIVSIYRFKVRFGKILPQSLLSRMEQLTEGFKQLKQMGDRMIPLALKDLNAKLRQLQQYVHAGGKPVPTRAQALQVQTGAKAISYAEEARLVESGAAKRVRRAGKYRQNAALARDPEKIAKVYKHEPGFPDLLAYADPAGYYPSIAAAAGKIENKYLSGVTVYRSFGPEGVTHGVKVDRSYPVGAFWGIGAPPPTAELWRHPAAVLDEWNRNGVLCIMHIPDSVKVPACVSTISEQFSKTISGQYLEGGASQAVINFDKTIKDLVGQLAESGGGTTVLPNGITVEVRNSNWTDVNEIIGYGETVIPYASVVERLAVSEKQSKVAVQGGGATAKNERAKSTEGIQ